jgi:hypothetical protein
MSGHHPKFNTVLDGGSLVLHTLGKKSRATGGQSWYRDAQTVNPETNLSQQFCNEGEWLDKPFLPSDLQALQNPAQRVRNTAIGATSAIKWLGVSLRSDRSA